MTLAEKIAALRGERKLSQGDLAEKLDVSRQSVSKWETGQAVPELDKIIKLADLFGVTVDQLVREGDAPQAEADDGETVNLPVPETKIVYVERPKRQCLTPVQILGVICAVMGAGVAFAGVVGIYPGLIPIGVALFLLSLPLLLAKKHPVLIASWMIWVVGYLTLCNPYIGGAMGGAWQPFTGAVTSLHWLAAYAWMSIESLALSLFFLTGYTALSVLTIVLPVYTLRLGWKKWKGCGRVKENPSGE